MKSTLSPAGAPPEKRGVLGKVLLTIALVGAVGGGIAAGVRRGTKGPIPMVPRQPPPAAPNPKL